MAVVKMNALACALAFAGLVAPVAAVDASYSDCSSTQAVVTQEAGSTTSEGTILSTWSMCTVVHQTHCEGVTSTGGQAPPPPSGTVGVSSVPGEGSPSSYGEDVGDSSTYHGEGSTYVTGVNTVPGATQPGYSVPTSGEGNGSIPPGETPTPITGGAPPAGSNTYTDVTGHHSGTGSESNTGGYATNTGTGTEGEASTTAGPSDATGTPPTTTATGAASVHNPVPAAILGVAGMIAAVIF